MQVTYTALGGLQEADDLLKRTASRPGQRALFGAPQDEVSLSEEALALVRQIDLADSAAGRDARPKQD